MSVSKQEWEWFTGIDQWAEYKRLLEAGIQNRMELLCSPTSEEHTQSYQDFLKGEIAGARTAIVLPYAMIEADDQEDEEEGDFEDLTEGEDDDG